MYKHRNVYFFAVVILIIVLIFRDYFFKGLIPFPANLLVNLFSPWNTVVFPGWEHGIPFKPMGLDNLNLFYPYKDLSLWLIKNGTWPLWNSYNFTGNVLLGNFQSAIFYPLNILYFLLPQIEAWSWLVIIQPFLAWTFTFLFLRCFPIRKIAAFYGALVFAFSGEMIVWMGDHLVVSHTIIWLPLILYSIENFLTKKRWYYYAISVLGLVFSFFAGFLQPFFYVFCVSLFYLAFRITSGRRNNLPVKKIIGGLSIFIISIGIGAIQLLPSLEALMLSPRNVVDVSYLYNAYLMPVSHLLSFIAPDYLGNPGAYNFYGIGGYHESILFIGILPLIFAIQCFKNIKRNQIQQFFCFITIITLILGLNLPFIGWFYELKIPIVYTFLPSRIFFITTFALSILSAFGIDYWLENKSRKQILLILNIFLILVLFLIGYGLLISEKIGQWENINNLLFRIDRMSPINIQVFQKNLIIPGIMIFISMIVFIMDKLKINIKIIIIGIFFLTITGQMYFAQKYLSFSSREFVYPNHPVISFLQKNASINRFWTYGDGYINANFATFYRIYSPDGTDALFPSRLGEIFYATEIQGKIVENIPRIDVRIARASEGERMTDNKYRLRLLSILGVKYVTDLTKSPEDKEIQEKKFPSNLFNLVYQKSNWKIYEYKAVLPRIFLTDDIAVEENRQKNADSIFNLAANSKKIILEEDLKTKIEPLNNYQEPKLISYETNSIKIKTKADTNAFLFLSDSYYPGWKAFVDNKEQKIYRANYAFRALYLPAGNHDITFVYDPESFTIGKKISLFSLMCFIILSCIVKKKAI